MLSILLGLSAALSWGASDYFGGLSSRKNGAYVAVFFSESIGLLFLCAAIPFVHESGLSLSAALASFGAGAIGVFGLLLLYQAMAKGPLSVAAPVSALLSAVIPILVGMFSEGFPGPLRLGGFALALSAIWLFSKEENSPMRLSRIADLGLPLLAGVGFGLYFVLMHNGAKGSTLWPLILARVAGTMVLVVFILARRSPGELSPRRAYWGLILANAVLDIGGSLFYVLAGQAGRMDVAAVLSALYPGATVFLAWAFLKERIHRAQTLGILAALSAIVLLTA
jgi:drug/metabolite transporter (DMT)-like permease